MVAGAASFPGDRQEALLATLACFWHPVCRADELPDGRPLAVRLLERDVVVARLADGSLTALEDRCVHRSTKLSVGSVDGCTLRCAYHGWTWSADGTCTSIPSLPDGPIPAKAVVPAYDVAERYGLVWVRLDRDATTSIPSCRALDPTLHAIMGEPYTWSVAALRRVENFVDLAHFAWVHDGSLGRRDEPVPPIPRIERVAGELRFVYDPPDFEPDDAAMYGTSAYRMPMPCTVDIEFRLASGARRVLWMTASPMDRMTCRSFWYIARDDDLDGDVGAADMTHLAFQRRVLAEDEPVVCAQLPGEFPLDSGVEVSVSTDRVSNEYRRWIRELVRAYTEGGADAVCRAISASSADASESSSHDAATPSAAIAAMAASS